MGEKNNLLAKAFGIGLIAYAAKILFSNDEEDDPNGKVYRRKSSDMKRVFVSFAKEDSKYRDFLSAQSNNKNSPFEFDDMSVKEPWDESVWKKECRAKIRKCDGMIVLLSKNTWHSSGARWEIKCAKEEGIPVIGMHVQKDNKGAKPPELHGKKVIDWTWDNLAASIDSF